MNDFQIIEKLTKIKGIGEWTALANVNDIQFRKARCISCR